MNPSRSPPREAPPELDPLDRLPDGPAFLFVRAEGDTVSYKGVSPFKLKRALDGAFGHLQTAKVLVSGQILVQCGSKTQAAKALQLTSLLGVKCRVIPADRLNSSDGRVYAPSLKSLSEEELLFELAPQGVIRVARLRSKGNSPNPLLKVTFRGLTCPPAIFAGYEVLSVERWLRSPMICRRCTRYGHTAARCKRRDVRCGRCGDGGHVSEHCEAIDPQCLFCQGDHEIYDKQCPKWQWESNQLNYPHPPQTPPLHLTAEPTRAHWPPATYAEVTASPPTRHRGRRPPREQPQPQSQPQPDSPPQELTQTAGAPATAAEHTQSAGPSQEPVQTTGAPAAVAAERAEVAELPQPAQAEPRTLEASSTAESETDNTDGEATVTVHTPDRPEAAQAEPCTPESDAPANSNDSCVATDLGSLNPPPPSEESPPDSPATEPVASTQSRVTRASSRAPSHC